MSNEGLKAKYKFSDFYESVSSVLAGRKKRILNEADEDFDTIDSIVDDTFYQYQNVYRSNPEEDQSFNLFFMKFVGPFLDTVVSFSDVVTMFGNELTSNDEECKQALIRFGAARSRFNQIVPTEKTMERNKQNFNREYVELLQLSFQWFGQPLSNIIEEFKRIVGIFSVSEKIGSDRTACSELAQNFVDDRRLSIDTIAERAESIKDLIPSENNYEDDEAISERLDREFKNFMSSLRGPLKDLWDGIQPFASGEDIIDSDSGEGELAKSNIASEEKPAATTMDEREAEENAEKDLEKMEEEARERFVDYEASSSTKLGSDDESLADQANEFVAGLNGFKQINNVVTNRVNGKSKEISYDELVRGDIRSMLDRLKGVRVSVL